MKALYTLIIALIAWFLLYYSTLWSMAEIWWRSDTFAHGMLIFPISLYLIWLKKDDFFQISKKPSVFFLLCLLALVFIWGLAKSVDVQVVQQFAVILMLPLIVGALFGFKMLKHYIFPLGYLLFAVPFGEFLIPKLQEYTAIMTVFGLEVSGVPVYSEGMFISIPEGDFEVAVACSGVRYLIASLALGTLYAYLTYTKFYKQVIFVIASIIVPIIANGIRAYGIVMIAHLSDMKYATGADHLVYGWFFFGIVIFILFFIGSFWQDKPLEALSDTPADHSLNDSQYSFKFALPIMSLFLGPMMVSWMAYEPIINNTVMKAPTVSAPWQDNHQKPALWQPLFINADSEVSTIYSEEEGDTKVYYYSSNYQYEKEDKELISSVNQVFSTERWILVSKQVIKIQNTQIDEWVVRNNVSKLIIWSWYEVFGLKLIHPITIKIAQALGKLSGMSRGGQFKAIALPFHEDTNLAKKQLEAFLIANKNIIN
ncbi:MAG: exosortase A [Gammaproteobacteria bacterium]|nr:exosortase A [Gammaproteobacteria bacterium]